MHAFWHNIWNRRLSILAWTVFFLVSGLTAVCLIESMALADLIKKFAEAADVWIASKLNIPVSPTESLLSFLAIPYRLLKNFASDMFSTMKPVVQYLHPFFETGIRKELYTVFGLAGSIIPAVYNARAKRMRGILVADMTKYFFPLYGIVMLENLALSLAGRFIVDMNGWLYLFPAVVATTGYSIILLLATGLYDRVSQWFALLYIKEQSRILRTHSQDHTQKDQLEERTTFLSDLSGHISRQLAAANTPYCITGHSLKREIQMAADFVVNHDICSKLEKDRPGSVLKEYELFFSSLGLDRYAVCDGVYFDLPVVESARKDLLLQIELASQFWQLVLEPISGLSNRARSVCRVFDTFEDEKKHYCSSRLVMICGLIVSLYKWNHAQEDDSHIRHVDYCARFASEMWSIFCSEKFFVKKGKDISNINIMLYAEMLILVWTVSQVEQYLQGDCDCEDSVSQYLREFWSGAHVYIAREIVRNNPIKIYLSLAMCMICQLPSPANRPLYPAQVKKLREYILSQKNRIGV